MSIKNIATEAGAATAAQKPMNLKTLWIGLGVVLGFAAFDENLRPAVWLEPGSSSSRRNSSFTGEIR